MAIKDLVPWNRDKGVEVRRVEDALPAFHRAFDNLFDEFFRGGGLAHFGSLFDEPWAMRGPALDVRDTPSEYLVSAELPGWDEKEIEVRLSGDTLTLRGERKEEEAQRSHKGDETPRQARRYSAFERSLRLPLEVDRERVTATTSRGVLTIRLPKTEAAQSQVRKIEIKAA